MRLFWAATAVIMICRGGEFGAADIERQFQVFVLLHNCTPLRMDTNLRGFYLNFDEAARQKLHHGRKLCKSVRKYDDNIPER